MPRRSEYQAAPYHLHETHLDFYIHGPDHVTVTAQHRFMPREGRAGEVIELNGEAIDLTGLTIHVGDAPRPLVLDVDYTIEVLNNLKGEPTNETILRFLHPPAQPFTLVMENHIDPTQNTSGHGLYQSDALLTTQCESAGFRRITYFIDRPDNLAIYHVTMNAPDVPQFKELLSNGNLISYKKLPNERHEAIWHDPFPKPSYLFAMVTGDVRGLDQVFTTHTGQPVQVRVLAEPEYVDQLAYAQDLVLKSLAWQEAALGLTYDLDRYHCVGVKSFTQGAMENKSLNIFNVSLMASSPEYSTDGVYEYIEHVIPHELMHNYAGNRVTIRTWHELALKEGLATLLERLFVEHNSKSKVPRIDDVLELIGRQFKEDSGNAKKAVRPESYDVSNELYTATTYVKGAEIHYMLRHLLGPVLWTHAIRQYFAERDGQAITFEEYLETMGRASGRDLSQFLRWVTQPGTPELEIESAYDARRKEYHLTVRQTNVDAPLLFPLQVGLLDPNGREIPLCLKGQADVLGTTACLEMNQLEQTFTFTGVLKPPIPSLLRDYSAPVKIVKTPVTEAQQLFLMHHDTDPVNKALAANQLKMQAMKNLMAQYTSGAALRVDPRLLEAMRGILLEPTLSPDLKMCLLALPDEDQLTNELEIIDPDALRTVYRFMNLQVANACSEILQAIIACYLYEDLSVHPDIIMQLPPFEGDPNSYSRHNAGIRSMLVWAIGLETLQNFSTPLMKIGIISSIQRQQTSAAFNIALNHILEQCTLLSAQGNATSYLAGVRKFLTLPIYELEGIHPENVDLILMNQLKTLQNELAACKGQQQKTENWLRLLGSFNSPLTMQLIRELALPEIPDSVSKTVFDMANPNMARNLIGSFVAHNPRFHDLSGEGYALWADYVVALDMVNHEAAGMVTRALTDDWDRMEFNRRRLIYQQLCRLQASAGLSDEVLSKVQTALEKASEEDRQVALMVGAVSRAKIAACDVSQGLLPGMHQVFLQTLLRPEHAPEIVRYRHDLSRYLTQPRKKSALPEMGDFVPFPFAEARAHMERDDRRKRLALMVEEIPTESEDSSEEEEEKEPVPTDRPILRRTKRVCLPPRS